MKESITEVALQNLISYLLGTCLSLSEACDQLDIVEEDINPDQLEQIYSEIFCCETCSWWCEVSEQSEDEENCNDCFEDN